MFVICFNLLVFPLHNKETLTVDLYLMAVLTTLEAGGEMLTVRFLLVVLQFVLKLYPDILLKM